MFDSLATINEVKMVSAAPTQLRLSIQTGFLFRGKTGELAGRFIIAERYRSAASVSGAERAQARSVTDMLVGSSAWFGLI